jgi:hypothetical protein
VEGRVVGVSDGDTITVLDSAKTHHKIRFAGIDAPENGQAFGERSKQSLSTLVFQKRVEAQCHERTARAGRTRDERQSARDRVRADPRGGGIAGSRASINCAALSVAAIHPLIFSDGPICEDDEQDQANDEQGPRGT